MKRMARSPSEITSSSPSTPCSSSASRTSPTSAGLSSISRIEPSRIAGFASPGFSAGDRKVKCRAPSGLGLDPDSAAGALDNSLAYRETHPGSGVFGGAVKTLKNSKDLLLELRLDPDPVIPHGKQPMVALRFSGDVNPRRIVAAIADGVSH